MPEKPLAYTDPICSAYDGVDRIHWVPFDGATFWRRGGKAVALYGNYRNANANTSTLAGFMALDQTGVTGGHPETITSGTTQLPVDFGLSKSYVFPTTGRAPTVNDLGRSFDIYCDGVDVQYVNLNSTAKGILTVTALCDQAGTFDQWGRMVACQIPAGKRYGNI